MDQYWNNIDEDGESRSDCASSLGGDYDELGVQTAQKDLIPTLESTPENAPSQKKKRPPRKKKKKKALESNTENELSKPPQISSNGVKINGAQDESIGHDGKEDKSSEGDANTDKSITGNDAGVKCTIKSESTHADKLPGHSSEKLKTEKDPVWQTVSSVETNKQNSFKGKAPLNEGNLVKHNQVVEKAKSSKVVTPSWETVSKTKGNKKLTSNTASVNVHQQKTPWARNQNNDSPTAPLNQSNKTPWAKNSTNNPPSLQPHLNKMPWTRNQNNLSSPAPTRQIHNEKVGKKSVETGDWRNHKLQQRTPSQKPPSLSNSEAFPSLGGAPSSKANIKTTVWGSKNSGNPWGVKK